MKCVELTVQTATYIQRARRAEHDVRRSSRSARIAVQRLPENPNRPLGLLTLCAICAGIAAAPVVAPVDQGGGETALAHAMANEAGKKTRANKGASLISGTKIVSDD